MIILGTNSIKDTGYDVSNSVRMSGSTVNLQRDFSGNGNRRTWTYSTWFKLSNIKQSGFFNWGKGNPEFSLRFESATSDTSKNYFRVSQYDNSQIFDLVTTQFFADPSAWGHMVVAFDTTQGTASNRIKVYFNGTQITSFSTESYPDQNFETFVNQASKKHYIGYADYEPINGYLCETVFIDGQQLAPDQFGEFDEDSGIWKPIDVSGLTFGTNGYYLQYKETGTSQNASGIGADTSGGTNHFAVDDVVATDQSTDTCTNNFATFNPLIRNKSYNDGSLAEGNTYFAPDGRAIACSSIGVTSGKWYAEFKATDAGALSIGVGDIQLGIQAIGQTNPIYYDNNPSYAIGYYNSNGNLSYNGTSASYGNSYTDNDIIGVALDMDNYAVYFSKNGTFQNSGDPTSGSSKTGDATSTASYNPLNSGEPMFLFVEDFSASGVGQCYVNFGSPAFAISSGNTDGNGYGNFEYAVPSGYYSLNTKNLAEYG